jgi:integron integrase
MHTVSSILANPDPQVLRLFISEAPADYHQKPPPRLLEQVRIAIRTRHYSRRTEKAYVAWIRRYIRFHGIRHPKDMGADEIRCFLSHLATDRHVSASTQTQALSALLFLYRHVLERDLEWLDGVVRAKRSVRLPVVLTRDEVRAILQELRGVPWLVASLLYGCGLRLLEGLRLRVKDIDFERNEILVRDGKGAKDRVTMLPQKLKQSLTAHLDRVKAVYLADRSVGAGAVVLPGAIGLKYPMAAWSWSWQWVFPASRIYQDPQSGQRRRHHWHESAMQKRMRQAVQSAGIVKPAGCHTLRHNAGSRIMPGGIRKAA